MNNIKYAQPAFIKKNVMSVAMLAGLGLAASGFAPEARAGCNMKIYVHNFISNTQDVKVKQLSYKWKGIAGWDQMWNGDDRIGYGTNNGMWKGEWNINKCSKRHKIKVKWKCVDGDVHVYKSPLFKADGNGSGSRVKITSCSDSGAVGDSLGNW